MNIRVLEGGVHLTHLRTRMPFRYGITTLTEMPHAFVHLRVEVDGELVTGVAADSLPPKWFTKDPAQPFAEEIKAMLRVIRHALDCATRASGQSPFDLWWQVQEAQSDWGRTERLAPLLTQFGTSLVERALLEAVGRAHRRPFHELLAADALGIRLGRIQPTLEGMVPARFLPARPLGSILARHTVGLADPLSDHEIPEPERLPDGLPQSLEACIRRYGLRHFKIKLSGRAEPDLERVGRLAEVITRLAPPDFALTLDGNEQFTSMEEFRQLWDALNGQASVREFLRHLIFVEQPLHRKEALSAAVGPALRAWPDHPALIIDESDDTLESFPRALALGYAGTSHKNCKGVFKSVANAGLVNLRRSAEPARPWLLSGEDLCNVGPVALLQDLAAVAALGIESVERNGHHYNAGLSQFPGPVQEAVLEHHADLYHRHPAGWPAATVRDGRMRLDTVNQAPVGVGFELPLNLFEAFAG